MELGAVYLPSGELSNEKLFYYHFRKIANSHFFTGTDGNEIINEVEKEHPEKIKELVNRKLYDSEKEIFIEIEKVLILSSEEILVSNANNLNYYFSEKRILSDVILQKLTRKYLNT